MRHRISALAACVIVLSACTTVKINDDSTNRITHEGGADVAENLAGRACLRANGKKAVIVSTVNKDPNLPPGTGKQVTTFRCSPDTKPPDAVK
jgi:hypothetical protein